jgi:hypothetical protein
MVGVIDFPNALGSGAPGRERRRMRPIIAVMVVSLLFVPVGCAESRLPRAPVASPSPVPVQTQPAPREASAEERQLYAEREMQSAGLEKFRGGDGGVVTVLVVVLLVVVILVLLKVI